MTTKDRTRFCTEIQKKHGQKITFAIVSLFVAIHLGSTVLSALSFAVAAMPGIGSIFALAIMVFLFAGIYALHTGFCFIMIKLIRNQSAILGDLLAPFRNFKRTLRNSLPFVAIALATSFAAAMIIIASGTFEQMLRILENPEAAVNFPASFSIIIYAMFFVTLLLNLPLIYLPFFDFDMQKKPHKEVRSNAFALFRESLKQLFSGIISFAGKNLLFLLSLLIISILNIKLLSSIATFLLTITVFIAYASIMLMTAAVYQEFTQPEPEVEILGISNDETEEPQI
ncbi:MAG: hypothetical protein II973_02730 [Spirochaetaceae bacterium]|nr:hypothetical protein [Spirochaetaceae bacterium]MDD6486417.1 hypothetical protein [Spirochaetales bacterium]